MFWIFNWNNKIIFFSRKIVKEAKNSGKQEESKVTHSLTDSFTKQGAARQGEGGHLTLALRAFIGCVPLGTYLTSL